MSNHGGGTGILHCANHFHPAPLILLPPLHQHSVFFTGRMPFLPPNQHRKSIEGDKINHMLIILWYLLTHAPPISGPGVQVIPGNTVLILQYCLDKHLVDF